MEEVLFLQKFRSPLMDSVMQGVSFLGSLYAFMLVLPVVYWVWNRRKGWVFLLVFLLGMQINSVIKEETGWLRPYQKKTSPPATLRGRPSLADPGTAPGVNLVGREPHSSAFPSGHMQGGIMLWGGVALVTGSWIAGVAGMVLAGIIGVSRIYLGVHSIVDISGGLVLGILGIIGLAVGFRKMILLPDSRESWFIRRVFVGLAGIMMIWHPSRYILITGMSLIAAVFFQRLERHWVPFETPVTAMHALVRLAAGFIPAGLLILGYMQIPDPGKWIQALLFFVLGSWMVLGAPALFSVLRVNRSRSVDKPELDDGPKG